MGLRGRSGGSDRRVAIACRRRASFNARFLATTIPSERIARSSQRWDKDGGPEDCFPVAKVRTSWHGIIDHDGIAISLPMGDRRGGRPARLRRDRLDVLAARPPAADRSGHRLVGDRRVQRHDDRLSRHGVRQHRLGQPLRPLRPARDRSDRLDRPGRRAWLWRPRRRRCWRSSSSSVSWSARARRRSSRR